MNVDLNTLFNLLTAFALIGGLFFMLVAGLGLIRLPDFYHRMHAATKGATLGIVGMVIAFLIFLPGDAHVSPVNVFTKGILVIMFTFIANPVGAHLLSKAAHLDKAPRWQGTIGDELDEDV